MYECLVGYTPFYADDPVMTCRKILRWQQVWTALLLTCKHFCHLHPIVTSIGAAKCTAQIK